LNGDGFFWSAQMGGRRRWVMIHLFPEAIHLFSEMRARLQQVLARIGASEGVSEGFLPVSVSGCQSNRRVVLREPKWCQNISTLKIRLNKKMFEKWNWIKDIWIFSTK
jgi:hypothetical protein